MTTSVDLMMLRRSAAPQVVTPTTTSGLQANPTSSLGSELRGIRTVTFAPPERIVTAAADAGPSTEGAWAHLGPIMGFDDDADVGMHSAPLSGFRAVTPGSKCTTPAVTPKRTPTRVVFTPAGGSPQLVQNGTQSMPVAAMLRRSGGGTSVISSPVPAAPSTPGLATTQIAVDEHVRGGTSTFSVAQFRMPRAQTVEADAAATAGFPAPSPTKDRKMRHYKTVDLGALGAHMNPDLRIAVIAPGGGTVMNGSVYQKLRQRQGVSLDIVGQSRSPYDRYTEAWGPPSGGPPPNLESFAMDLLAQGALRRCDCLVVGSRGGQVCLPTFWRMEGAQVPPAVVLNGGCAMQLPIAVPWPDSAVTFIVIGGQDYFRQQFTLDQYINDARSRVPHNNTTTAIMLVNEMAHMPQTQLLDAILYSLVKAVTSWKEDEVIPTEDFEHVVAAVSAFGFHGKLIYKTGPGDAWHETSIPDIAPAPAATRPNVRRITAMGRAAPIYRD